MFVSLGSIIGSGWLLGALTAAQHAGPASVLSWLLAALMLSLLALTYAELGERDKAFYWLKRCVDDHSCTASEINTDPGLDPLRPDPRFSPIARLFLPLPGKSIEH